MLMAVIFYKWLFISFLGLFIAHKEPVVKPHPFYIAVTEVNHNASEKTLEISIKLFADDFEQILNKDYKQSLDIGNDKQKALIDRYALDYINKHLAFVVDGKQQQLNYLGFEKDKESAYCYLQIDNIASVKRIDVTNTILHDFNNTQINIVHAVVNGKRQSTKLDFPNKQASFSW
jgi:hypothetical protein